MAEQQKALPVAFGGKTITPITITDSGGTPTVLNAVIESLAPTKNAEITELKDGDGAVNGLIVKNRMTEVTIDFYVSESSIALSETRDKTVIEIGDKLTIDDTDFPEVDDGGNVFIVKRVTKNRTFGEIRKISIEATKYENDVSAEATPS